MTELTLNDVDLAERFQKEYTEQFHVLVRMHLSFLLDLNTDENEGFSDKSKIRKWSLVPFNKKVKIKGVMEGAPLTQEGICQAYQLIEFLKREENINVEGIFRRTGSLARQQELKNLLNQGITVDLESSNYSVHDCASVLKSFLAELQDPLLTEAHYPAYCQIAELCGVSNKTTQEDKLLMALQLILLLLPPENKVLLRDILDLLHLTASHENFNRMSSDNLAKLFTPHLLCPRKLTPEQLHINSQNLTGIIAFMITHKSELFKLPHKLLVDFRARYERLKYLNESVSDQFAANTVFTFVDQERTAKENECNTTETALAELYAYIQSLPESSKKRKLVKQFNKENGHGTPLQVLRSGPPKNKSLGDSIKKHIFHKNIAKNLKKVHTKGSNDEGVGTPSHTTLVSRARLFCTNSDSSPDSSNNTDENVSKKCKTSISSGDSSEDKENLIKEIENSVETPLGSYLTSTPACVAIHTCPDLVFTPDEQDRKSMSPITRSTQRMTRAMQETMMTPRSRKPVLLVSGSNINALAKAESTCGAMDNLPEEYSSENRENSPEKSTASSESTDTSLTNTFREYLSNRNMLTLLPVDSSFSSRTDDFDSDDFNVSESKLTDSLLHCLDGNEPDLLKSDCDGEKEPVLKPKQFDANGYPIVFETSF